MKEIEYVSYNPFLLLCLFVIRRCDVYATCVEFTGQVLQVALPFHHVGPENGTKVLRFGSRDPDQLNHLLGPSDTFHRLVSYFI